MRRYGEKNTSVTMHKNTKLLFRAVEQVTEPR